MSFFGARFFDKGKLTKCRKRVLFLGVFGKSRVKSFPKIHCCSTSAPSTYSTRRRESERRKTIRRTAHCAKSRRFFKELREKWCVLAWQFSYFSTLVTIATVHHPSIANDNSSGPMRGSTREAGIRPAACTSSELPEQQAPPAAAAEYQVENNVTNSDSSTGKISP